ncbi:MAG: hypothetical protein VKJ85_08470 [Prochlorothrix sp.]|nr:hypothetical protein [Prochlorothrix sp.]
MQQEVVQNFLDLPGIMGVALMDGRSRPFFCGIDQFLNFQQKEALAQGIRQVIETTPESFTDFKFQFSETQIYIYKLNKGLILLVLANNTLTQNDYGPIVLRLKATLQEDLGNAIATFRLLVGNATLSGQSYWNTKSGVATNPTKDNLSTSKTGIPGPRTAAPNPATQTQPSTATNPATQTNPDAAASATIKAYLDALNQLSQCAKQYLGTAVIVNYWKSSRPDDDWLTAFEVERSASLKLVAASAALSRQTANARQAKLLREWVAAFVKRCSVVIRDFSSILDKGGLDDQARKLLL